MVDEALRGAPLGSLMERAVERVRDHFVLLTPSANIELRDKRRDHRALDTFFAVWSAPDVLDNVKVKVEFFPASPEHLCRYQMEPAAPTPQLPRVQAWLAHVNPQVPTGAAVSLYADKLKAIATRPEVKWRDLFDLWWLKSQVGAPGVEGDPGLLKRMVLLAGIYNVPLEAIGNGLARFAAQLTEDVVILSRRDLMPWLPLDVWMELYPDVVREMVALAQQEAAAAATLIAQHLADTETPHEDPFAMRVS